MTRAAVIRFPGSNCETETGRALEAAGIATTFVWHREADIHGVDLVVLPGGFSYGDDVAAGRIFANRLRHRLLGALRGAIKRGVLAIGVCNGFQVLTEAGLLPGALARNEGLAFVCRTVAVRVERDGLPLLAGLRRGEVLRLGESAPR